MALGLSFLKTGRDYAVISILSLICCISTMVYSLQAPFYPREAESKGATSTEYGLVLGSYELVILVTSPIASNLILRVGPWAMFSGAAAITGSSTVAFGFLGYVDGPGLFVGLSFMLRFMEAVGAATIVMCVYAFALQEFQEGKIEAIGIVEIAFGAGLTIGPVFGSLLYSAGEDGSRLAFLLPFLVIGSLHFVSAVTTFAVLRRGSRRKIDESVTEDKIHKQKLSFLQLIKMLPVVYFQFIVVIGTFNFGFLHVLVSTHLMDAGVSTAWAGGVFLLYGVIYTFSCPFVAKYSNSIREPIWLLFGATFIYIASFALFAISDRGIWTVPLTCVAVALQGLGLGNTVMTGYVLCLREAAAKGYDDDESVSAQVSAFWSSAISLGGFVGPSAAGFLFYHFGFFSTALIFMGVNVALGLTIPFFQFFCRRHRCHQPVPTIDFISTKS